MAIVIVVKNGMNSNNNSDSNSTRDRKTIMTVIAIAVIIQIILAIRQAWFPRDQGFQNVPTLPGQWHVRLPWP